MKEKYTVSGSNTLYKVWGIIVIVFTCLAGLLCLIGLIALVTASAWLMDGYSRVMSYFPGSLTAAFIILFLLAAVRLALDTMTGILLIRDYIKAKETFIVFAVIYFVFALLGIGGILLYIAAGAGLLILISLLGVLWNIATGILLLLKQSKAVPSVNPEPVSPVIGLIEGQFGAYWGRQYELHAGTVYKIGRDPGCEIHVNHPKVSRIHCTVCKFTDGRYQITDCSSNGTFYGNSKLQKGVKTEVEAGGMLVLGEADNVLQLK